MTLKANSTVHTVEVMNVYQTSDEDIRQVNARFILEFCSLPRTVMGLSLTDVIVGAAVGLASGSGHPANVMTLADMTNLPRSTVRSAITRLKREGIIVKVDSHPWPTYARNPDPAIQARVSACVQRMNKAILNAAELLKSSQ